LSASNSICCCICTCRTDIALSEVDDGSNVSVNAYIRTLYKQKANFTLLVHFVSNDDTVAIIMTISPLIKNWNLRLKSNLSCKAYVPLLSSHSHHPVFLWSNCICSTCREWQILVPFTILISLPVSHIFVVAFGHCNPQPLCIRNSYLVTIA
jgi:hypothetical protein